MSNESVELQNALNSLSLYCDLNGLTVNITKTKCLAFYQGSQPGVIFTYKNNPVENCNQFTYLGIVFTTRLSAAKHVNHIISKCNAKIGILFSRFPMKSIPLCAALDVFDIYVLPVVTYALPIWFQNITESLKCQLNSLYTKFLKRYLGLPYSSNNAIIHYMSQTSPLIYKLNARVLNAFHKITFPVALSGLKLTPPTEYTSIYNPIPDIPSYFWASTVIHDKLPILPEPRRALLYDTIDLHHFNLCSTRKFHTSSEENCICKLCHHTLEWYHYRECPELSQLTPCSRLKRILHVGHTHT